MTLDTKLWCNEHVKKKKQNLISNIKNITGADNIQQSINLNIKTSMAL